MFKLDMDSLWLFEYKKDDIMRKESQLFAFR